MLEKSSLICLLPFLNFLSINGARLHEKVSKYLELVISHLQITSVDERESPTVEVEVHDGLVEALEAEQLARSNGDLDHLVLIELSELRSH